MKVPKFKSLKEEREFWDTHDTTDYPAGFTDVDVKVDLKGRRFEIEIDEDVMDMLRKKARRARASPARLASRLLRKELTTA